MIYALHVEPPMCRAYRPLVWIYGGIGARTSTQFYIIFSARKQIDLDTFFTLPLGHSSLLFKHSSLSSSAFSFCFFFFLPHFWTGASINLLVSSPLDAAFLTYSSAFVFSLSLLGFTSRDIHLSFALFLFLCSILILFPLDWRRTGVRSACIVSLAYLLTGAFGQGIYDFSTCLVLRIWDVDANVYYYGDVNISPQHSPARPKTLRCTWLTTEAQPNTLPTLFFTAPERICPPMPPSPRPQPEPTMLFAHRCLASRSLGEHVSAKKHITRATYAYVNPITLVTLKTRARTTMGINL